MAEKFPCVWPLLLLCARLVWAGLPRGSVVNDELLPYGDGHHGPRHSNRHVRDCQPVAHGNLTHERWTAAHQSGRPVSHVFVTNVLGTTRQVYGHMTTVLDPLNWVSVLEPKGPGGCGMNQRASVEETSAPASCVFSQNAGFFNTHSGACLGNVVSDGRLVQDSGGIQNAQFGIKKDGTLVFGYLSEDEVLDQSNPFVQLVSGVIWLLRDGEVYIEQSLEAECDKSQETGLLRHFVDVVSARTAVGHDAAGRLMLFQIDGKTGERGGQYFSLMGDRMNLWEVANFLKENGAINAINLDGGGSSTFVARGSLASYPSDLCEDDKRWRCARSISTILCVRPPPCEQNCSSHGDCLDGQCRCWAGWTGPACDALRCRLDCGAHGVCTAGGCVCDAGWRGKNCTEVCHPSFYGEGCSLVCRCLNGGWCEHVHGRCTCPPGFYGDACQTVCPAGFFGVSCAQRCRCEDHCPCDHVTGSCNFTARGANDTLYSAGLCLAKQMRRDAESAGWSHLNESTWLAITVALSCLLAISLLTHLLRTCRGTLRVPRRHDYMYVPLSDIHERPKSKALDHGAGDSESQDEQWLRGAPTSQLERLSSHAASPDDLVNG
ncbi:N-acetylglucosamine-1-phosphodiester alpha-N-acetylglucosaminidase isoform X2 [Synchiropus splendidus]|uniref:N-acetylglucosamine-1-phosphodiester alpha-N-acetylglucosaminidase isoform X2 n=1 Tax=Synchiropus splendidus TaxID=270530 RepID=UPI00237EE8A4|nr:N-acetylglucosamine-1-phosphodiester alpha-N-acetylglucosaminidase isoform X2 [Synchiropus splendidus]